MKTLKTYADGRMPVWQGDIAFLQTATKEVLLSLISELGLGKTNFIITGCQITQANGTVAMTAGWVYLKGDILPVQALSQSFSGTPLIKLTKVERFEGQKTFNVNNTAVTRDVYQNDYVQGTVLPTSTSETYDFAIRQGAWTLAERLQKGINDESGWIECGYGYGVVSYKRCGRMVQLKGNAFNDAIGGTFTNATVATNLPIPAAGESLFSQQEDGTSVIKIDANGNLIITSSTSRVWFNHIVYLAETNYVNTNDWHMSSTGGGTGGGGNES